MLKCIRCRQIQPLGFELCEKLEQGSICIDETKLTGDVNKRRAAEGRVKSMVEDRNSTRNGRQGPLAVDLFEILPHKYTYQDGCLGSSCSGQPY